MQSLFVSKCSSAVRAALTIGAIVFCSAGVANAGAAARQSADGGFRGYDEYTGPYARASVAIGRIDFDNGLDRDVSGGFGLTAGYRFLPWLSGEFDFQYLGGKDNARVANNDRDSEFWAFTIGPKLYPLGLVDIEGMPENVQPYAFVGIGGGEADIDGSNRVDDESTFVGRFILGIDWWINDNIGLFMEGGGFAADDDDIDGAGVFSLGGQYRF